MELPRMMNSGILFSFFLLMIQFSFTLCLLARNETDRLSLLAFKAQITEDPLGILSSWNESLHFCEWSGVTCGRRHQIVVELDLRSTQLVGSLSPHLGNLSFLRMLNLDNNSFSHSIPQELGRLFRLRELSLWNNSFSGEIPVNISQCSKLLTLHIAGNKLTGKLPAEFGSLSKLQVFGFEFNDLVSEIPPSFGNLSSIETLFGTWNKLQGSIPPSIGQLKKLKHFALAANNLSGTIPPSMYNLSSLTIFSVAVNNLHGSLPLDLGLTLPNLEILQIHTNQFSGPIPETISNASKLTDLQLSRNNFTGKVPPLASLLNLQTLLINYNYLGNGEDDDLRFLYSLANNTRLEVLATNDNKLGGVLPEIVSNFSTKLRTMTLARNQIRGRIPTDIGNLISLEVLALETNQLTGTIPSSLCTLQNLVALHLSQNKISGTIPTSLGNITSLIKLFLFVNNLQGSIPSSLGYCQNLLYLDLSRNNLSGPIPKEVFGISSSLIYFDLSKNQLIGSLPMEVSKLVHVGYLNVSHNRLSGEIPKSLGSCTSLEGLYLEENFFQGHIPESLSSLKAIGELYLSYNNLTGQIPRFLGNLKLLQHLDLSSNDFEGELPIQGVFGNASAISISGNKKLCGGIPQLNLSRCTSNESKKLKSSIKLILIVTSACGFPLLILITSFMLFYCLRRRKNKPASWSSRNISFLRVSYEDLLQATNGFSSGNLIGVGSFGSVYKGILSLDETVVAVKVLNLPIQGASKSFIAECTALTNVRHRNLIKLSTACSSTDFQGNDFKALVYEYMVNGSLEEWLHPIQVSNDAQEPRSLNLILRLNIAIDVASALDYLHNHCETPVIHCDLKPSNVLLDGDLIAHVGDFGLARFLRDASHHLSSYQTSSVALKGTIGYAAPEYGMGSEVSTYGDVYSYGILLLEMFTGKRPTDGMFRNGLNLHNFAKMASPDCMVEVLDPVLLKEAEETSGHTSHRIKHSKTHMVVECLISIIKVGVACSVEFPRERVDISYAAAELHRIRDILLGTRTHTQCETVKPEGKALPLKSVPGQRLL